MMKETGYAFMFEGVGIQYTKYIHLLNEKDQKDIKDYCDIVEKRCGFSIYKNIFSHTINLEKEKDLKTQIIVYTLNCAINDIYKEMGMIPKVLMGHSMGYYAALYASGAVSFETGLDIVINAYKSVKSSLEDSSFTAVLLIGLTMNDVDRMIRELGCEQMVEIAIENNEHCILVSGVEQYVNSIKDQAMKEGVLKVIDIDSSEPYHTHYVEEGAKKLFRLCKAVEFKDAKIPIVSCVDQRYLQGSEELREEIYRNIRNQISWKNTVLEVGNSGVKRFIEVGLDDGLVRMSKLIHPDYLFLGIHKLPMERVG